MVLEKKHGLAGVNSVAHHLTVHELYLMSALLLMAPSLILHYENKPIQIQMYTENCTTKKMKIFR